MGIAPVIICYSSKEQFLHICRKCKKSLQLPSGSADGQCLSLFPVLQIKLCPVLSVLSTDLIDLTPAIDKRAAVFSYVRERVSK